MKNLTPSFPSQIVHSSVPEICGFVLGLTRLHSRSQAQVLEPKVQEASLQYSAVMQVLHCLLNSRHPECTCGALCQKPIALLRTVQRVQPATFALRSQCSQ